MNILYTKIRISKDTHIMRKIITSNTIYIRVTKFNKNANYVKRFTRHSILIILENKDKKLKLKE